MGSPKTPPPTPPEGGELKKPPLGEVWRGLLVWLPTHLSWPKVVPPNLPVWGFVPTFSDSVRPCLREFIKLFFKFLFRSHHDDADIALRESGVALYLFVGAVVHHVHLDDFGISFG